PRWWVDSSPWLGSDVCGPESRILVAELARDGRVADPAVLGVNTNTVLRALRQLRDEGLLEFRRGRGITVTGTPEHSAVIEQARELLHYARTHGYKRDELIQIIEQLG